MGDMFIIGLTGPMGAGKSVVANMVGELSGFSQVQLSFYVKQLAKDMEYEVSRDNLQMLGRKLRRERGPGAVALLALADIEKRQIDGIIIDGIRSTAEIDEFTRFTDRFYLIGVNAPLQVRFERQKKRGYLTANTLAEFERQDEREQIDRGNGFNVASCLLRAKADENAWLINNDGGLDELERKVQAIWDHICDHS